jgi:hypothetical protein
MVKAFQYQFTKFCFNIYIYEIRSDKYEDMTGETKNAHKILIWKSPGKLPFAII